MASPQQPRQHTKSLHVTSLSFHCYDVSAYIDLRNGLTQRYNLVYDGMLFD